MKKKGKNKKIFARTCTAVYSIITVYIRIQYKIIKNYIIYIIYNRVRYILLLILSACHQSPLCCIIRRCHVVQSYLNSRPQIAGRVSSSSDSSDNGCANQTAQSFILCFGFIQKWIPSKCFAPLKT